MHEYLEVQLTRSPFQTAPGEGLNVTYQTAAHESEFERICFAALAG